MGPEAWQRLLAAELPAVRLADLRPLIESRALDQILAGTGLTKGERARMLEADMGALDRALAMGARTVEPEGYPVTLSSVSFPPPALFVLGEWECVFEPAVAIVGTRAATTYGRAAAQKFAEELARAGVTIVSGGAVGIDSAAHKGALAVEGKTVAVLGSGIDRSYPLVNRALFTQIAKSGCLVSQFAAGSAPNKYRFLIRNGLIASLSCAVLIVEAPIQSGAMVTARCAAELGRQVFVVPANIDNEHYRGSHSLIRDGATLVEHPDQILADLGLSRGRPREESKAEASGIQRLILDSLSVTPLAAEFIAERTGLEAADVMTELTMLELEGRILRDAGGYALRP